MHSWINSQGEIIKTRTIKEFAQMAGIRESNARSLACGHFKRFKSWCSTHRRAKRHRKRFTTALVNTHTEQKCIIGPSVTSFCRAHNLSTGHVHKLLAGEKLFYRGWCLASVLDLTQAQNVIPAVQFQNKATMPHPKFHDAVVGL